MDLALFDFDGTITNTDGFSGSDSFSSFIRFAVRPNRKAIGCVVLGPAVLAYRLGWISASRVRRAIVRVGFQGESSCRVRQLGWQFATEVLPLMVRRSAVERVRWHQGRGDDVVVVSAALDFYLRPWCRTLGVECLCTELEERNGLLTGRCREGDCTGAEKVRRITRRFPAERYSAIYAYGDTAEDREMLNMAHRKYYRWEEVGL
jgi:phosphatidylglycerophosphatase C